MSEFTGSYFIQDLSASLPLFNAPSSRGHGEMGNAPARGTADFCFGFAALRVCGPSKKQFEQRSFLAPPQKAALDLASRSHSLLVPREKREEKEKQP